MNSALFPHQLPTLPQKIDSSESLFRCKKGVVLGCGRMNIYYNKPSFAPTFGPFLAKYGAMQCVLVLIAVHFGAKRSAF